MFGLVWVLCLSNSGGELLEDESALSGYLGVSTRGVPSGSRLAGRAAALSGVGRRRDGMCLDVWR